ncbi:MAG TPA: ATP-binding cassette domain-containing protein [Xanthobacteraceae bacterium]|nr:ATP-binding cassette domain-containing protein [Xanthobacteraceae bacterium]
MARVSLQDVSLRIPVYDAASLRLLRMPAFGRAKVGTRTVSHAGAVLSIHALNKIDLELVEGDRLCLIGHNGAGKTSLLRLIAGIYPPSDGRMEVVGKAMALLGNSLALNSDATGYENIRLVASLYDWPKAKVPEYIRDIEEFTELGEYLSLPTRIYSAGMLARLAFAMATMQSPDVLLIDEGIGAGDVQFQSRAQVRMMDFAGRAKIMVLASHSVDLCRALCNKALVMSKGSRVFFGDIDEAFERYRKAA